MVRAGIPHHRRQPERNASVGPAAQVTQSISPAVHRVPTLTTATPGSSRITLAPPHLPAMAAVTSPPYPACGALTATGSASPIGDGLDQRHPIQLFGDGDHATGTGVASTLSATPAASAGAAVWGRKLRAGRLSWQPAEVIRPAPAQCWRQLDGGSRHVIPRQAAMNLLVGSLSAADRLAVANYIADFIPTVSATTAFNTPVVVNVGSQVFEHRHCRLHWPAGQSAGQRQLVHVLGTSVTYTPNLGFVGTDTFTHRATQAGLNSDIRTVTVTVQLAALTITSALSVSGTIGVPFSYQIAATNVRSAMPRPCCWVNLTVNTSSGLISGTPAAGAPRTVTHFRHQRQPDRQRDADHQHRADPAGHHLGAQAVR
jgi:hypothetical protein